MLSPHPWRKPTSYFKIRTSIRNIFPRILFAIMRRSSSKRQPTRKSPEFQPGERLVTSTTTKNQAEGDVLSDIEIEKCFWHSHYGSERYFYLLSGKRWAWEHDLLKMCNTAAALIQIESLMTYPPGGVTYFPRRQLRVQGFEEPRMCACSSITGLPKIEEQVEEDSEMQDWWSWDGS